MDQPFTLIFECCTSTNFRNRFSPVLSEGNSTRDASHPAHQVSVQLRESIRTYIMQIASQAGVRDPESFSQQYLLLIGGASLMATIEGNSIGAQYARNALSILIDASGT